MKRYYFRCYRTLLLGFALYGLMPNISVADNTPSSFFQWHTSNIQLLRGFDYELGDKQRSTITFEHANGWHYGDNFIFIDSVHSANASSSYYGEFSPRFSLGKLVGKDLSTRLIKDVLISTTIEKPKHSRERYLYGAAIDLNIHSFKFFKVNAYIKDTPHINGKTWQLTLAWNTSFTIAGVPILAEGFSDIVGQEGGAAAHQLIVPRLLVDIGKLWGHEANQLFAGIEWQYWHNKFGKDGVIESVPQAQLKWVF